jgi:hypothetical protein
LVFYTTFSLPERTNFDTFNSGELVKRLPTAFYRLSSGREPVREWLKALAAEDRRIIGEDIKDVEFSWPLECRCVARSAKGFGKFAAT